MMPATFIAIGSIFITLLIWLAARLAGAQDASRAARRGPAVLPSRFVTERICSKEDLEFVASEIPGMRNQFVRQRKVLLLLWLDDVYSVTAEAVDHYRASVRGNPSLRPTTEIRLASDYLRFLLLWQLARFLILVVNPATLRSTISGLTTAAEQIALCTRQRLLDSPAGSPVASSGS